MVNAAGFAKIQVAEMVKKQKKQIPEENQVHQIQEVCEEDEKDKQEDTNQMNKPSAMKTAKNQDYCVGQSSLKNEHSSGSYPQKASSYDGDTEQSNKYGSENQGKQYRMNQSSRKNQERKNHDNPDDKPTKKRWKPKQYGRKDFDTDHEKYPKY